MGAGRVGSVSAWIRSVARSTISRAAGERVALARCTTAIVSYCLGLSGTHPASGANRGNSCPAAPLGMTVSATPRPTSSTAVSTSSTSTRVVGLSPVSCIIRRSTIRVESTARQVVSGITSDERASCAAVTGERSRSGSALT